jgi:hypothetical protein
VAPRMQAVVQLLRGRLGEQEEGPRAARLFQDCWTQLRQGTETMDILQVSLVGLRPISAVGTGRGRTLGACTSSRQTSPRFDRGPHGPPHDAQGPCGRNRSPPGRGARPRGAAAARGADLGARRSLSPAPAGAAPQSQNDEETQSAAVAWIVRWLVSKPGGPRLPLSDILSAAGTKCARRLGGEGRGRIGARARAAACAPGRPPRTRARGRAAARAAGPGTKPRPSRAPAAAPAAPRAARPRARPRPRPPLLHPARGSLVAFFRELPVVQARLRPLLASVAGGRAGSVEQGLRLRECQETLVSLTVLAKKYKVRGDGRAGLRAGRGAPAAAAAAAAAAADKTLPRLVFRRAAAAAAVRPRDLPAADERNAS